MRVSSSTILVVAAAAFCAATGVAGADPAPPAGSASVRVVECSRGPAPEDRTAAFRSAMQSVSRSERMGVRFTLQERSGTGRFQNVSAPGLGVWRRSRPGVGRFGYRQRVVALAEGAAYRVAVAYRWYDAGGAVVARTKRSSRTCKQGGMLPDLKVRGVSARADAEAGLVEYTALVANEGRAGAGQVLVALLVDGAEVDEQRVTRVKSGQARAVSFMGPPCVTGVQVRADPRDEIREADESNGSLTVGCPPASR